MIPTPISTQPGQESSQSWLGEYIQDNYDIPDRRGDAAYAYWNNDYESYTECKRSCIYGSGDVYAYLMLINDAELSVRFALRDGSQLAENGTVQKLLAALPEDGGDKPVLPDGADPLCGGHRPQREHPGRTVRFLHG